MEKLLGMRALALAPAFEVMHSMRSHGRHGKRHVSGMPVSQTLYKPACPLCRDNGTLRDPAGHRVTIARCSKESLDTLPSLRRCEP